MGVVGGGGGAKVALQTSTDKFLSVCLKIHVHVQ